jgi:serine/threonine protein kinase
MRGYTVHIDDTVPIEAPKQPEPAPGQAQFAAAAGGHDFASSAPVSAAANSENVHRSGQMVDRYRITRLIAEGGTSRVYEAVHQFTKKPVALKVMRHRLAERRDVIERFRQEAVVLASIRHENVVAVENAGLTDDGRVFIAMELLRGRTLRDLLRHSGKLNPSDTVRIIAEVVNGVSAAHAAGVAHRDLKPENIFCATPGGVKVLDLGTAKFAGENAPSIQTALGRVIGTVAYIAPERFHGEPGDVRSDIYALGLITYECLAGYHPMVPDGNWPNATEIASRQVEYEPGPFAGAPPALWRVISKAMQKSPGQRYQSAIELLQALRKAEPRRRAVVEEPLFQLTTKPSVWTRYGTLTRRSIRPILAGSVFGAVVAGSLLGARRSSDRLVSAAPVPSVAPPSLKVDARPMASLLLNAPVPSPAFVAGSATPMPTRPLKVAATTQPALSAASSRSTDEGTESPPSSPLSQRQVDSAHSNQAVEGPPVRTKGQAGIAGRTLGDYDSAPLVHVSKDDLPASGL